ncbi:hypothetical protein I350_06580 [Cryptococcus amylolentus CBS 6273]|uniref:Uncharacterized protein n=1 Tax=Cryptococcus amylolentus CBS 6273 TaxID=1296118 RepID=A0A1E3JLJ0_9TREE|nr:hypothetical protein I350_06580 [Cryptococcus amylolentus CBS 6273]
MSQPSEDAMVGAVDMEGQTTAASFNDSTETAIQRPGNDSHSEEAVSEGSSDPGGPGTDIPPHEHPQASGGEGEEGDHKGDAKGEEHPKRDVMEDEAVEDDVNPGGGDESDDGSSGYGSDDDAGGARYQAMYEFLKERKVKFVPVEKRMFSAILDNIKASYEARREGEA